MKAEKPPTPADTLMDAIASLQRQQRDARGYGPTRAQVSPQAATLIATLFRTIEAQLEILREALRDWEDWRSLEQDAAFQGVYRRELALAHAILRSPK